GMSTPMGDLHEEFFDDSLQVVGDCLAARVWRAEDDGVLTGVTFRQPWVEGENTAFCVYSGSHPREALVFPESWRRTSWHPPHVAPNQRSRHRPGFRSCSCGFFAYHDGDKGSQWSNAAGRHASVVGIVQVYGLL